MNTKPFVLTISMVIGLLMTMVGCNGNEHSDGTDQRGNPSIVVDSLVYDADSKTFSLSVHADSAAEAEITYYFFDGDSLLQTNTEGVFRGITPLMEGYDVQAQVVWKDTTVMTPLTHISNFIVPSKPVEKITKQALQTLINTQDKSLRLAENEQLSQSVHITTQDGDIVTMQDIFLYLNNKVWSSVEVVTINYNENNQVTDITIRPTVVKVKADPADDEWFDEF